MFMHCGVGARPSASAAMGAFFQSLIPVAHQPGLSLMCAGLERSIVFTAAFSSTAATQPAAGALQIPLQVLVEASLSAVGGRRAADEHPVPPAQEIGYLLQRAPGSGVRASFLARRQDKRVGGSGGRW